MPSIPPAGVSAASAFDITSHPVQLVPPAILADKIDPATGDFESILVGRGLADAMAIEALRIDRGSGASVRDVGNRYRELRYVDGSSSEVAESMTREAFAPAEEAGVLRLVSVSAEPNASDPSQTDTLIEYRDLLAPDGAATRRLVFTR